MKLQNLHFYAPMKFWSRIEGWLIEWMHLDYLGKIYGIKKVDRERNQEIWVYGNVKMVDKGWCAELL